MIYDWWPTAKPAQRSQFTSHIMTAHSGNAFKIHDTAGRPSYPD
jgi:hypothetical protein